MQVDVAWQPLGESEQRLWYAAQAERPQVKAVTGFAPPILLQRNLLPTMYEDVSWNPLTDQLCTCTWAVIWSSHGSVRYKPNGSGGMWSADGRRFAYTSYDMPTRQCDVRILDWAHKRDIRLALPSSELVSLALHPNEPLLLVKTSSAWALYDYGDPTATTLRPSAHAEYTDDQRFQLTWSPDGRWLSEYQRMPGVQDKPNYLLLRTGRGVLVWRSNALPAWLTRVSDIAWSPDSTRVQLAPSPNDWTLNSGIPAQLKPSTLAEFTITRRPPALRRIALPEPQQDDWSLRLAWKPDGALLAVYSERQINLYTADLRYSHSIRRARSQSGVAFCLFHPILPLLTIGDWEQTVQLLYLDGTPCASSSTVLPDLPARMHMAVPITAAWNAQGSALALGLRSGQVAIYPVHTSRRRAAPPR